MSIIHIPKIGHVRRGNQFDALSLPDGCTVQKASVMSKYLDNNPLVREKLESIQRMLSAKKGYNFELLALMRRRNKGIDVENSNLLDKNAEFATNVRNKQIKEDNLILSGVTNENVEKLIA